ncbi:cytochrome P450 [Streptomyces sp. LZ34]
MTRHKSFDAPHELGWSDHQDSLRRFVYPDGHIGWLVTGYALSRMVLADSRFSSRAELKRVPLRRPGAEPFLGRPTVPGWFIDMDRPDHTRYRRLLAGQFTAHRLGALRQRIGRIVAERLDVMERTGAPVDLIETFALPVPLLTISEMLGVPAAERDEFHRCSTVLFSLESTPQEAQDAMGELTDLFLRAVKSKRRESDRSADGLLRHLAADGGLADREIAGAGVLLLTAGHETVSGMLGLGTYALLTDPGQLIALRQGQVTIDDAVEELLRFIPILHHGVPRGALEDVELEGQLIKAGDAVTISLPAANRDPGRFEEAEEFDLSRAEKTHIAFGHGVHQCIGQNLARIELRTAFAALFARFPELRLAAAPDAIEFTKDAGLNGVRSLPVAW